MALHWPLIIFTALVAWACGLFASQCVLALGGGARKSQVPAWVLAAILLAAGGIAVFFHLGHAERIFNGFGHLSSGITQELIAMVVLAIVAVIYLVLSLRASDNGRVPAWIAVLGIVAALAMVVVMAHSYMMQARPTWNSIVWVVYIVGNACALGPATLAAVMAARGDDMDGIGTLVLAGTIIGALCAVAYAMVIQGSAGSFANVGNYFDPSFPNKPMMDASGAIAGVALPLWGGAVALGGIVPVVLAFIAKGRKDSSWVGWGLAIAALAIIGAFCMRYVFFSTGLGVFMYF